MRRFGWVALVVLVLGSVAGPVVEPAMAESRSATLQAEWLRRLPHVVRRVFFARSLGDILSPPHPAPAPPPPVRQCESGSMCN